jgi:hypothetical protein
MSGSYGYASQLGIDSTNPITKRFDFQSESLVCDENFADLNGMRGTRSRDISRVRQGNRRVHGPLHFFPTTQELAYLLPWCFGAAASGTTYALADSLPTRFVNVDRVNNRFTYNGCVVDKVTFHGSEGNGLAVNIDVIGIDETPSATAFPTIALDTTTPPLMFTDLVLVFNSITYNCKEFTLEVNNDIDKDRFFNSQTLTSGFPRDRHVTITHPLPYGDASASYNPGVAGVAVTCTFTAGAHILTFSLANVAYPRKSPSVAGRQEILLPMVGQALKGSGTLELVTTLVI